MAAGTSGVINNNREYLFRLQTLIIDGGTEVIRNIFDQRLPGVPLNVFLAQEKNAINIFKRHKTITQAQYMILYSPGRPPDSADFDITLIICLLRNVRSLGLNQSYPWNVRPHHTDLSLEADLCRLKGFRNEVAHISSTTGFQQTSFNAKWTEIEQVLLRLNSAMPKPLANFNQTIDSYKHSPIDHAAAQKLQTTIDQWRKMEKGLEAKIKKIEQQMEETDQRVEEVEKKVNKMEEEPSQEEKEKLAYDKMKSEFQDDLISFYKDQHKNIPLSPLMEEDPSLLEFYEMPDIQSVKVTRSRDGDKQEKKPVTKLRDVFYKKDIPCSNIYLTADAGYGKTAFCKKLALAWCHANKPDMDEEKHFSKHEITVMRSFSFVFVVLLRDSSSECDIDTFILNQICSQLAHRYSEENVEDILCRERCLVILDGLDEWTHPVNSCRQKKKNIPHRRVRKNVTVLTTARPWKLSGCGLHSSQIDQRLELKGLSDDSAKKLKRSVISHLHKDLDERKIDEYEIEFNMTVQENHKPDLAVIPLFLMYFLFLWFLKKDVGKTLADLYSSFIELLLSRTEKIETKTETVQGNIPSCFDDKTLCQQFYTLLTALGKLAFYTLFSETKENTLVFDGYIANEYLGKDELTFCLKTGIITQSKVQGASLLQQKTKVSFAHKTMQEFLAALYINSVTDQKSIQEIILSKCKCVEDILDMSKMFMFIVSISGTFFFPSELMKIINEDEITQEYRRSLQSISHPLRDLQDMYISCSKEILRKNEVNFCLQDVFIDERCQQEEYRENLKGLKTRNKQNIISVYISMSGMFKPLFNTGRKVIDYFALSTLENIGKIYYYNSTRGGDIDDIISPLLNSSVTSLYLSCDTFTPGSWSRSLFDKLTSLQKLEAIGIYGIKMSHSELSLLLNFISQRDCLREIVLERLGCTDHGYSCTGPSLLWSHTPLRKLTLGGLHLSQVIINMASLEYCELRDLYNKDLVLEFVNCADNKLNTFKCSGIESSVAIDKMVPMLRESRHVSVVELRNINLRGRNLTLTPDFVNIEYLELINLSMYDIEFLDLVDLVLKLKQSVTVDIVDSATCIPPQEFETFKRKIKESQRVRTLVDMKYWFGFEKIKDGD